MGVWDCRSLRHLGDLLVVSPQCLDMGVVFLGWRNVGRRVMSGLECTRLSDQSVIRATSYGFAENLQDPHDLLTIL